MTERDNHKRHGDIEKYKRLLNKISTYIKSEMKSTYQNKIENGKDDPKYIWNFKEFIVSGKSKNNSNNDIFGIQINGKTVSDDGEIIFQ